MNGQALNYQRAEYSVIVYESLLISFEVSHIAFPISILVYTGLSVFAVSSLNYYYFYF